MHFRSEQATVVIDTMKEASSGAAPDEARVDPMEAVRAG